MRNITLLLLLTISWLASAQPARVAIVIDDIGYRQTDHAALALPGELTFAVLPHTPFGQRLALRAHEQHREVLLHIPMEALNGKKLGPGGLTVAMSEQGIRQSLTASFDEIPFAVGINNHMGSRLTQLYDPMAWTMRFLKERKLLFLDSMTIKASKAATIAAEFDVPTLYRSVFLDNQLTEPYIAQQFSLLIMRAKRDSFAIAIAHPHPKTIEILRKLLPTLASQDIELVALSDLLNPIAPTKMAALNTD